MDLFDKLRPIESMTAAFEDSDFRPFDTLIDDVLGPAEVSIRGKRTLMFGSNNYLGLTFHPEVKEAAKAAIEHFGSGTTGWSFPADRRASASRIAPAMNSSISS